MKASPHQRPSEAEAIEARAAAWLALQDDGLTLEQEREFTAWRDADPRHAAAVARLEGAWQVLEALVDFRPEVAAAPNRDLLAPAHTPRRSYFFPVLAAAAAVVLLLTLLVVWRGHVTNEIVAVAAQQYATTAGGYQRITLVDGSVAELNASTELRVLYTAAERRVQLIRGEAHFTVAKNKQRPFWVEASGVGVRAVGTAFNVRLGASQVEVLVTEGRVRVGHMDSSGVLPSSAGGVTPELGAGERTAISTSAAAPATIEKLSADTIRHALAWRFGPRLDFAETPLSEVVAQFNQHNRVQVELGDPALASEPVGGSFQAENVEAFVHLLTTERDIVAERVGQDKVILRRAK